MKLSERLAAMKAEKKAQSDAWHRMIDERVKSGGLELEDLELFKEPIEGTDQYNREIFIASIKLVIRHPFDVMWSWVKGKGK